MATVQITDVIVPEAFTSYVIQNSVERSAFAKSGVAVLNAAVNEQLTAGAENFKVPFWNDLGDDEANIASDNPATDATPYKLGASKQTVRKSFLHNSWSAMNLASELSGSDALSRIQDRAAAYWERQFSRRLIASMKGILADNIANDAGDMVEDISALTGGAELFSASAVIEAASTLGDGMDALTTIAVHSAIYTKMLKDDLVTTIPDSQGGFVKTFRGLAIVVDDTLPLATGVYTTALFGPGAFSYGMTAPRIAAGTEIENKPSSGNGGGQQILHSRVNLAVTPIGYTWLEGSVVADSPSIAELALAANWDRVVARKAIPLAFLKHK